MVGDSSRQAPLKICAVAYPKSGISWATRLLAEYIGCPARSLRVKDDPVNDGLGRKRERPSAVYKDHGMPAFIKNHVPLSDVVYVVRDVRDLIISAAHYFNKFKARVTGQIIDEFMEKMHYGLFEHGTWPNHVGRWLEHDPVLLRYEDLLSKPTEVLPAALDKLNIEGRQDLQAAIEKHSFKRQKQKAIKKQMAHHQMWSKFLRKGKAGEYKEVFTAAQKKKSERLYGHLLNRLGYEV